MNCPCHTLWYLWLWLMVGFQMNWIGCFFHLTQPNHKRQVFVGLSQTVTLADHLIWSFDQIQAAKSVHMLCTPLTIHQTLAPRGQVPFLLVFCMCMQHFTGHWVMNQSPEKGVSRSVWSHPCGPSKTKNTGREHVKYMLLYFSYGYNYNSPEQ